MDGNEFIEKAKEAVINWWYTHNQNTQDFDVGTLMSTITKDAIKIVSCTKTLQNNKAWLCTTYDWDGRLYEVNYNGDKKEAYVDVYEKKDNMVIHY